MQKKSSNRVLTIIGITFILSSFLSYFLGVQYYKMQDIDQVIEKSVNDSLKNEGFEVETTLGLSGYKVNLTFSDKDHLLEYESWCGCAATDFLTAFKLEHPETDKLVSQYRFTFLKEYQSYGGSYSGIFTPSYMAKYNNDQDEASVYDVKIALLHNFAETGAEPKTYLEHLKDFSTYEYDRDDDMIAVGEHYTIHVNDNNSYSIDPINSSDTQRNPDNTLMWYMDEYSSQFCALSNVYMETVNNVSGNTTSNIHFTYTNKVDGTPQNAKIMFYVYNDRGEIIDKVGGYMDIQATDESRDYVCTSEYAEEMPSDFRIIYIKYEDGYDYRHHRDEYKYIVFE